MRTAVLVTLLAALAAPAEARWERPTDPSEADIEAARALYERGLASIDALRWDEALAAFEEAYARSGVGAALYNVAVSLRALGRHVEARDAGEQLLREHAELDPALRADAERLVREERARVAVLLLEGLPRDPRPEVRLDGRLATDDGERPLRLDVDPGAHTLFVTAPGCRVFEWRGTLEEGAHRSIAIELAPLPSGDGTAEAAIAVVGALVAAGVAAAVVGWALWDADEIEPMGAQVIRL
ncbi:MAG TPA: hypothetical protein VIL20_02480 [Sandaracinaceae bacterium]